MEHKLEEFGNHERFMMRIHSLFFINKIQTVVSVKFINACIVPLLLKLAKDKVPNIRFNVSKTILLVSKSLSVANVGKLKEALKPMAESDPDFDSQFFAQQTLEQLQ